jgi:predicted RNA binding protein YcfA (HicA-like mRNA interferase family)
MVRDPGVGLVTYRQVVHKLLALGCQELPRRSGGSHRKWFNPATRQATVVPDWGSRDLKLGTVRAAIRQLGLDWRQFHDA